MEERSKTSGGSLLAFLKSHPIICLLLLTPGIPEYLSSSSPINALILNPPQLIFQILANLGLYGSGALLIHDARIRWNKGWATVLLLGAAYGILEEGVALSTLFNTKASPVGSLGVYGHWLGVNWVWSAGIVPFHALWSISLPILLLGLTIPETVNKTLLSRRRTIVILEILAIDVMFLMILTYASGYWMGGAILAGSLISIGVLVGAAYRVSPSALTSIGTKYTPSNRRLIMLGMSFFPVVFLSEALAQGAQIPASIDFVLVILLQGLYLWYVTQRNWHNNQSGIIAFALGLIIPIAVFGVLAELALPMTLLADLALFLYFRWLRAKYLPKEKLIS